MLMFALEPADPFAEALAGALKVAVSPHEERVFPDGERKLRVETTEAGLGDSGNIGGQGGARRT